MAGPAPAGLKFTSRKSVILARKGLFHSMIKLIVGGVCPKERGPEPGRVVSFGLSAGCVWVPNWGRVSGWLRSGLAWSLIGRFG